MEGTFVHICRLLVSHGAVPSEIQDAEQEWNKYSLEQQRAIYRSVRDKIRNGKFVNYHPVLAIRDNSPKAPRVFILSADEYYRRYGTQTNQDGWVRTFLPKQQRTIYVKQM
ncbi:MAG: hypothetical protein II605_01385 [Paludibacteraceae bacterium]|nr:hypothetical protein [Paludibacteraceae bacterium]MBQ2189709.1 hypothetical protein [Paludibacteraceae bacterium]MBQ4017875.1 hypothetical protein [Paludibacteraceae bacterium]